MNVRFEHQGIRFRLHPEELEAIFRGDHLTVHVGPSDGGLSVRLHRHAAATQTLCFDHAGCALAVDEGFLARIRDEEEARCDCQQTHCLVQIDRHARAPGPD